MSDSIQLVDTHCHLYQPVFEHTLEEVIGRAFERGVRAMVVPGLDLETSEKAVLLAETYDSIFAAVGFHPNSLGPDPGDPSKALRAIKGLSQHPKVVAIGEIGLDYYRDRIPPAVQKQWLSAQLILASEVGLPVILHNRNSTHDMLHALALWARDESGKRLGVLHSFEGSQDDAEALIRLGFYIGFSGPLTYKKADELRSVAAKIPSDRILIETDSPFLTPEPHRGKRNEPGYVLHVCEQLALILQMSLQDAVRLTTDNAIHLFQLQLAQS
nr:TatD family hydrolase [Anaerolineae bacterium]